jgi:hypothetical protein
MSVLVNYFNYTTLRDCISPVTAPMCVTIRFPESENHPDHVGQKLRLGPRRVEHPAALAPSSGAFPMPRYQGKTLLQSPKNTVEPGRASGPWRPQSLVVQPTTLDHGLVFSSCEKYVIVFV